jgi:hypothetical protein
MSMHFFTAADIAEGPTLGIPLSRMTAEDLKYAIIDRAERLHNFDSATDGGNAGAVVRFSLSKDQLKDLIPEAEKRRDNGDSVITAFLLKVDAILSETMRNKTLGDFSNSIDKAHALANVAYRLKALTPNESKLSENTRLRLFVALGEKLYAEQNASGGEVHGRNGLAAALAFQARRNDSARLGSLFEVISGFQSENAVKLAEAVSGVLEENNALPVDRTADVGQTLVKLWPEIREQPAFAAYPSYMPAKRPAHVSSTRTLAPAAHGMQ